MQAIGYFVNEDKFIPRGQYKETELDQRKKEVDFLLQAIDSRYTISFNKPIELKESRSIKRANNDGYVYFVTERAFELLKQKYTYKCDF
mgnify:CR=1 FL=1